MQPTLEVDQEDRVNTRNLGLVIAINNSDKSDSEIVLCCIGGKMLETIPEQDQPSEDEIAC